MGKPMPIRFKQKSATKIAVKRRLDSAHALPAAHILNAFWMPVV
jgi:hypothetical protein